MAKMKLLDKKKLIGAAQGALWAGLGMSATAWGKVGEIKEVVKQAGQNETCRNGKKNSPFRNCQAAPKQIENYPYQILGSYVMQCVVLIRFSNKYQ